MTTQAREFAWRLRSWLYRYARDAGRLPTRSELAEGLGASASGVDRALRFLAESAVVVLDGAGEILMAHPFSGVATPFRVRTPLGDYWANCAWDAIAIPLLLETDGRCDTRCPNSGAHIDLAVTGGRVEPAGAVIRLPVPVRRFWDDIGFT